MSGGAYDYLYLTIDDRYKGEFHDPEMDEFLIDFCNLLHDLEWWQSGDYSEEKYRTSLQGFKDKWFKGDRQERQKDYIDKQVEVLKGQLYEMFGIKRGDTDGKDDN